MESKLKLVTINGKEYQLDIEQAKKLNLLKEKDNRVRSWKEFENKYIDKTGYIYAESLNTVMPTQIPFYTSDQLTSYEAKAIVAFSKLLKLRRDWVREWESDFTGVDVNWAVYRRSNDVVCDWCSEVSHVLSFPTEQIAKDFLETFRDLIEEAKILI